MRCFSGSQFGVSDMVGLVWGRSEFPLRACTRPQHDEGVRMFSFGFGALGLWGFGLEDLLRVYACWLRLRVLGVALRSCWVVGLGFVVLSLGFRHVGFGYSYSPVLAQGIHPPPADSDQIRLNQGLSGAYVGLSIFLAGGSSGLYELWASAWVRSSEFLCFLVAFVAHSRLVRGVDCAFWQWLI